MIGFDNVVELREPFTSDKEILQRSIEQLRPGTGGSKLYDAMSRAVALLENVAPERRRVLIVAAEAQDRGSRSKFTEALEHAVAANVTIYSIGLSTAAAQVREPLRPFLSPNIGKRLVTAVLKRTQTFIASPINAWD